ncbi:hypothetical protein BGZ61DRAFT_591126 [Ilyonectria robusta]|uniref:uncharacterized protein n=1 Tax=Ilyonectria robusta TaxID=1079257 RepID=UPI001E8E1BE8|nr:uncharacterized protein BGZ61DRAFT_591126 [Ilyonectria robusta]KAH8677127.1 hypothetical protein BGZ61DRAFT_591126 [Ilyonectria robusta]
MAPEEAQGLSAEPTMQKGYDQQDVPNHTQETHELPPLQFPMASQPLPHNQRTPLPLPSAPTNIGGEEQVRAQPVNDHPMAYAPHLVGSMVQNAYNQPATIQPNTINLDCQPQVAHVPPRSQPLHMGRTGSISATSQVDRMERNGPGWPNNHGYSRNEDFNAVPPTPNRSVSHRNGSRSVRGNRRGGYNQRNVTIHNTQPSQGDQRPAHNKRDGTPYAVNTWRRQSVGHQAKPPTCRNSRSPHGSMEYVHCTCEDCNQRNCTVHVAVQGNIVNPQVLDIQTRIKFGLGERFGIVVDVFPLASKDPTNFLARFSHEQSVVEALATGGADMPERGISVLISPSMRSKWMNRPREGVIPTNRGRELAIQQSAYPSSPLESPIATNQPLPLAYPNTAGIPQVANFTQHHGAPMHLPNTQIVHAGFQAQPYFSAGHIAHPGFTRQFFPNQTPYAGQHSSNYDQAQQQGRRRGSSYRETPSAPRAALSKRIEAPQPKLAATEVPNESKGRKKYDNKTVQAKDGDSAGVRPAEPVASASDASVTPNKAETSHVDHDTTKTGKGDDDQAEPVDDTSEKASPTLAADPVPEPCDQGQTGHSRVPSIFTEEEIKERKKAWARISMPIGPRKTKAVSTNANETAETASGALKISMDSKVGNSTSVSERSSPVQSSGHTPEPYEETTMKPPPFKPTKGPSGNHPKHRRGASGRNSRQSDRSGPDSSLSTPTSPHLPLVTTKPSELHLAHQGGNNSNQAGEAPRKNKNKGKNKKKKSQQTSTTPGAPATPQAGPSKETSPHQGRTRAPQQRRPASPVSQETSPQNMTSQVPRRGSLSPAKRPREENIQQCRSTSPKRNKQDGDEDPAQSIRSSTHTMEETRGRLGYRAGAGGSLRIKKPRKARPLVTEPSVAEQHLDTQVAPPSSDFAFECSSMAQNHATTNVSDDADQGNSVVLSVQSQLNPKAKDFQSPSRLPNEEKSNNADANVTSDNAQEISPSGLEKANNEIETAPPQELATTEEKDEKLLADELAPGTSAPAGTKKPSKSQKRDKGKNRVAPTEEKGTPAEKGASEPHTPNRALTAKKAGLDKEDWPSLPPPRDRAASKSSTPSLWGAKKTGGSGQGSPVNK